MSNAASSSHDALSDTLSSPFVLNTWYMAAWDEEIGSAPLARTLVDLRIVLYRVADGTVVALRDRCPHRFAPLSRGSVKGDKIVCGYHGLGFAPDGHCASNPFGDTLPRAKVRAFPVVVRDGIVWLWPGDPATCDDATVPDFSFQGEAPDRRTVRGYTRMEANYLLGSDNLMDLSHIEFLHTGTFAGGGVIFQGHHEIIDGSADIQSNWMMPGISPPPWAKARFPGNDARVDHWLDMQWTAPACMRLDVGLAPAGDGRSAENAAPQAHILTPETGSTTHYFWSATRTHDLDPASDDIVRARLAPAFDDEDKPMIEAVQRELGDEDFWSAKPLFLGIDAAGTRVRRRIEAMIRSERDAANS